MNLQKLSALYIVLLLIQSYMVYKNEDINCSIGLKRKQIKTYNYDEYDQYFQVTPINYFWQYLLAMTICLPLIHLFQLLFRIRFLSLAKWFTVILYTITNIIALIFENIIMGGISELYKLEYINNVSFHNDVIDCNKGKLFYIGQLLMCATWQILLTIIYLLQNNKLNPVFKLMRGVGLVLRLVLVIISKYCIQFSYYILPLESTRLEKNKVQIQQNQQIEQIQLYIFYISLIVAQFILLIKLQLQEVFTTIGSLDKKYLNFLIFFGLIISLLLIFSPFLYEKFIILYFIIQINSYQRVKLKQVQENENDANSNIIYCDFKQQNCEEYITLNQSIVYFRNESYCFHQECFNQPQIITNYFHNIQYYYLVDLSKTSQGWYQQGKLNFCILYILNFVTIFFLMMDNKTFFYQSTVNVSILAQLIINCLSLKFHKTKMTKVNCFLQMVVFIFYCLNLASIFQIYEQNQQNFIKNFPHGNKYYLEQFNKNIYLFIYNILITLIQAYQISYLIIFERIQKGMHKLLFFAFILMNIQSIVFFVHKVQLNYLDGLFITIYLLNLWFLILFISKKLQNLENFKIYVKKKIIFTIKVIALGIILILVKLKYPKTSEDSYYDFFYQTIFYQQVTNDEIVMFSFIIINIQFIFYLLYLYCQEAKQLLTNQLTKFQNLVQLERPIIKYALCSRCFQIFQRGYIIYYNLKCNHFIHKQCIRVEWMNYEWCCQESGNLVIEIHIN